MARSINTNTTVKFNRTDVVNAFLAEAKKHEVLTPVAERELFARLADGDESVKEKIYKSNMRFVISLVSKFAKPNNFEDLISEATIGMYEAMDSFEYMKGYRFITYAVHYMRMKISEFYNETAPMVRRSTIAEAASYRANRMSEKFYAENGRYPSEDELMDILNTAYDMGIKDTADLVQTRISSVNEEVGEDGDTAMEIGEVATATASTNDYEREIEKDARMYAVERALSVLSPRDKEIITLAYGLFGSPQYDNDAIAEKFGMSAENVRLLKIKALKRIQVIAKRIEKLA